MKSRFIRFVLVGLLLLAKDTSGLSLADRPLMIQTIHGHMAINDPLIIELIESPAMQRLKKIRQYGVSAYVVPTPKNYTRFEHSLGVFYILNKYGCSRYEQIAGLLHDISHTVFSHTTDLLFVGNFIEKPYQDRIQRTFLIKYGIAGILERYGISVDAILPSSEKFPALEQEKPALCADRIEYNIFAGYMDHGWTFRDIEEIHTHLHFNGQDWYFDSVETARKFAEVPLYQTVHRWGSAENHLMSLWMAKALERALETRLITLEDIHFNLVDDEMWNTLKLSSDPVIQHWMHKIQNVFQEFTLQPRIKDIKRIPSKFSGVDPLVATPQGLEKLSDIDAGFKCIYQDTKVQMRQGWPVVLTNP